MTYILSLIVFIMGAPHTASLQPFDSFAQCMSYGKSHTSRTVSTACYRAEYDRTEAECQFRFSGKHVVGVKSELCAAIKHEAKL